MSSVSRTRRFHNVLSVGSRIEVCHKQMDCRLRGLELPKLKMDIPMLFLLFKGILTQASVNLIVGFHNDRLRGDGYLTSEDTLGRYEVFSLFKRAAKY